MNQYFQFLTFSISMLLSCQTFQTDYASFEEYPIYQGNDLGVHYTPSKTTFRLWAPTAELVRIKLYNDGVGGAPIESLGMNREANGLWSMELEKNLMGFFYTFQVKNKSKWLPETPGIYAKAAGVNGLRAAIVDFQKTNPEGWENDKKPPLASPNDIIIYEMHVRDMTSHPSSGSSYPGKFIGLVERGTKNPSGLATGIDHLVELGITHVHLLPSFDYLSVDESRLDEPQFNWGYDPQNYNIPEGSYSSDPYDPVVRIHEFKQMVKGFHESGIRVILDVVYNHTGTTENSNFNLEVPGYYYRHNEDGSWSDAAACGNETASERFMMRKFMLESCKWWVEEYHIDGFRFDLMGIHDIETMNLLSEELKKIDPNIFIYGEGWTAKESPLPAEKRALKANTAQLNDIAAFSDELRDGIKGSVFEDTDGGFLGMKNEMEESIKFGVVGATRHQQVNYEKVNYSKVPWSPKPSQTINYVSCHDNLTLYDKLKIANKSLAEFEIIQLHKLANVIVLTSQGIPFLHAGVEMRRTKGGEHNSYNKPDSINQINWNWKTERLDHVNYYKALIALRKAHPAFRIPDTSTIRNHLHFLEPNRRNLVAFQISNHANGDEWKDILVYYNASEREKKINLPKGQWHIALDQNTVSIRNSKIFKGRTTIPSRSAIIFYSVDE